MTTKTMHTPGPWEVGRGHFSRTPVIYGANRLPVCTLYSNGSPVNMDRVRLGQRYADSNLIAAAPDLREALQAIADHYAGDDGLERAMKAGIDAEIIGARAVLTKATTP